MNDDEVRIQEQARAIEERVGHPGDMWEDLQSRVRTEALKSFRDVQEEWLRLMWTLDEYRRQGVPPLRMGKLAQRPTARLAGVYRGKGNWFATLIALLLQGRTSQMIRPRVNVRGFSQVHQIDLAWPARDVDPLVCVETKVTGAPSYNGTPSRGALADFANRRKELKFAATDLKLWRRQQQTSIDHWGDWRAHAPPTTYFLWAARLRTDRSRGNNTIERLIDESKALVETYLDGAGIFAWEEKQGRYEAVPIPRRGQVTDLDDVLYRIESEIRRLAKDGQVPPPQRPVHEIVDVTALAPDDVET